MTVTVQKAQHSGLVEKRKRQTQNLNGSKKNVEEMQKVDRQAERHLVLRVVKEAEVNSLKQKQDQPLNVEQQEILVYHHKCPEVTVVVEDKQHQVVVAEVAVAQVEVLPQIVEGFDQVRMNQDLMVEQRKPNLTEIGNDKKLLRPLNPSEAQVAKAEPAVQVLSEAVEVVLVVTAEEEM